MANDPAGRFSSNRLFEWVSAVGLLNTSLVLMIWPHTLAEGNLRPLLHVLPLSEMMAVYFCIGLVRIVTLMLNGSLARHGPPIRALMASLSLIIWVLMVIALWLQLGQPSVLSGLLIALAGGELRSVQRAKHDLHGK